jgi:integrase
LAGEVIMKKPTGFITKRRGSWWVRVSFTDAITGKRRELTRAGRTRAEVCDIRDRLIRELTETSGRSAAHERARFADLANYYAGVYLRPAEYRDDRKVAGLRGLASANSRLEVLVEFFGARPLRSMTYGDLLRFKESRLNTPTVRGGARAIASVHRELELLRRMLTVAVREGWLLQNPFNTGDPLISKADEKRRERILTVDEERRLLAAADRPGREHLRPILICAIDTGMRLGEMLKLQWADVDLFERTIQIRAFNTKTLQARTVHMTERLHRELALRATTVSDAESLVFGVATNVKRSFSSARREADLVGVRFHDLRHTAATRLCAGLSLPEVGRILGHQQPGTTYRYINADAATARRAAAVLDEFNGSSASADSPLLN